ncbi:MAG: hypothetical protein V1678_01750 [Candidatus Aenigmatarchaeota archaeon]
MAKKSEGWVKLSGYLFLLGILMSIIAGVFGASLVAYTPAIHSLLAVFGLLIGLLGAAGMGTIDRTDTQIFLLSVIALAAAGGSGAALGQIPTLGPWLSSIVGYIAVLVVPAAVIIALEAIWRTGAAKF